MHSEFTAFVAWPPRDRHRLMLAAHELGHVVAWQHAGFAVAEIKLHPGNVGGEVSLSKSSRTNLRTIEQRRGYLVGLLAGTEAGARWCELMRRIPRRPCQRLRLGPQGIHAQPAALRPDPHSQKRVPSRSPRHHPRPLAPDLPPRTHIGPPRPDCGVAALPVPLLSPERTSTRCGKPSPSRSGPSAGCWPRCSHAAAIATAVWLVTGFSSLTFVITAAVCVIWASVALYIWRAQLDGAVRRMHRGLTKRGERW